MRRNEPRDAKATRAPCAVTLYDFVGALGTLVLFACVLWAVPCGTGGGGGGPCAML